MALAPADFYAYSNATGVPVPEDPEERARMAPEVLEFRRNQLKAPESKGPDPLSIGIGIGLAAAGLGAGAYGIRKFLQARGATNIPKQPGKSGISFADLETVAQAKPRATESTPRPSTPPPGPTEVDIHQAEIPIVAVQHNEAVESGSQQFLRNFKGLPANVNLPHSENRIQREAQVANRIAADQEALRNITLSKIFGEQEAAFSGLPKTAPVNLPILFNAPPKSAQEELIKSEVPPSVLSQIRERRAQDTSRQERIEAIRELKETLQGTTTLETGQPTEKLAEALLRQAKERKQKSTPAPITEEYRNALFDVDPERPGVLGLIKPEIIAKNLGDPNVFPADLQDRLAASITSSSVRAARRQGRDLGKLVIADPAVHLEATNHIIKNLLAEDNADSVKDYLLSGGEYGAPRTKGFGYTGSEYMPTQVFTTTTKEGKEQITVSRPKAPARRTRSDLEPLYFDPDTGVLIRKSDIGATQQGEAEAGSGIGHELGQAVAFVPREAVESFVSLPGVSASGPTDVNKQQGTGYAFGGLKELGAAGTRQISSEQWQAIRQRSKELGLKPGETNPEIEEMLARARGQVKYESELQSLPIFTTANDAFESGAVRMSANNTPYLKLNKTMLVANPGLEYYDESVSKYGVLFKNPLTGQNFSSVNEAAGVYNRLADKTNQHLISRASQDIAELKDTEQLTVELTKSKGVPSKTKVYASLNPDMVIDRVARRLPSGETVVSDVTLSQALRNTLLNPVLTDAQGNVLRDPNTKLPLKGPSLIQEHRMTNEDGTPGATFFKQSRYVVPEERMYQDKQTGEMLPQMLGLQDTSLPLAPVEGTGTKNNYLFLQGVNNSLERLTGKRVKVIDDALKIAQSPEFAYYGGENKNPVLRQALTIANTLVQTAEPSRVRIGSSDDTTELSERYGQGARVSAPDQRTVPSNVRALQMPVQQVQESKVVDPNTGETKIVSQLTSTSKTRTVAASPEVIGGKRLAAAMIDHKQRTGRALTKENVLQFASSIAQQEGTNVDAVIRQASIAARGRSQQLRVGPQMSQGRRALSAMDIISPAEEIAQTVAEYDFGETVGSDIESMLQGPRLPMDVDPELAARQAARAKIEQPGSSESFGVDEQRLANLLGQLRAQNRRRSGKKSNR